MYKQFTDRASKIIELAYREAQRFEHEHIGTAHVLLGLVKEDSGIVASVFENLDINLSKVESEVEKLMKAGSYPLSPGKMPQTSRVKKAIEYSIEESRNLHHSYVSTEHLLLGLLRVEESVAVQVFANLDLSVKQIRGKVLELLGPGGEEERKTNFSFAVNIEEGEDAKVVGKVAAHYKNILGRIKESIHHADSKAMDEIRNILKDI